LFFSVLENDEAARTCVPGGFFVFCLQISFLYTKKEMTAQLAFDQNGFLTPCEKTETSLEVFQQTFVNPFPQESTRHELFVGYLHFLKDFKEQVSPHFTQWIGGSFVTQQASPNDVDFVTLIDFETYEAKERLIDTHFRAKAAEEKYGVDAFTLRVYPENHKGFSALKF
jgi:hypothetical protein